MDDTALFESFCAAVEAADLESLHAILDRHPAFATAVLPDGWPVFLLQSVYPKAEIIDLLLAHGADPNARNPDGETLLHLTGDPEIIEKLVAVGADINGQDHQGNTPMMAHAPFEETAFDAIYTFLSLGADPKIAAISGATLENLLPQGPRYDQLRKRLMG